MGQKHRESFCFESLFLDQLKSKKMGLRQQDT